MNSETKIAAFYARVSTAKQEYSLNVQLERARKYAAGRNLELPDAFAFQDAETSKKPLPERDGGARLLNTIAYQASIGAPITHLIITKLDRLDRTTKYFLESIEAINAAGVTLHITDFMGDSLTTGSSMGKFFLTIMSAFAELERSFINERTAVTLQHLRDKNICTGSIPYGKTGLPIPGAQTKSKKQQYNLVDNPAEIQTILLMNSLRLRGHSFKAIADHLNKLGIPTKIPSGTVITVGYRDISDEEGNFIREEPITKITTGQWQCGNVAGVLQSKTTSEILHRYNQGEPHAQAA